MQSPVGRKDGIALCRALARSRCPSCVERMLLQQVAALTISGRTAAKPNPTPRLEPNSRRWSHHLWL